MDYSWGLSFIVPGTIIAVMGITFWLFLVPKPDLIGLQLDQFEEKVLLIIAHFQLN